jgi:hypothetical protein
MDVAVEGGNGFHRRVASLLCETVADAATTSTTTTPLKT